MLNESIGDRRSLSLDEFRLWLRKSNPRDGIVYARGDLGGTISDDGAGLKVAVLAWNCHVREICCLVQRATEPPRPAPDCRPFDYIAYKKSNVEGPTIESVIADTSNNSGRRIGLRTRD